MALKVYYDLLSQPSRAVYMFMKFNKIPFEDKPVALRKGEHFTEEFAKINPFKLVPVIDDNGFVLTESVAILKYLSCKYNLPDHWYPRTDLRAQARVDEYCNWQHLNTRGSAAMLFRHLLILPRATNEPIDMGKVEKCRKNVRSVVTGLEKYYLKSQPFLCGNDISIADILGSCELLQLHAVHEENLYESSPVVKAWMQRVRERLQPTFDDASKMVYRTREVTKSSLGSNL
ncbi:LOW QUALITY PROTEIN: glutathione S-transferase theta-1-like [Haliotis rubra]|uniref:LOW QUALITY PROTEIN: glutathione S-transferase theta-1-like n=1 Tax=Haliotis rubra TaxID=36100 RepID=UPI001EE52317|nr:LOW QUALITY PROTEIN: glutathione S-transferase theta-1-like [Haliotis rubra]